MSQGGDDEILDGKAYARASNGDPAQQDWGTVRTYVVTVVGGSIEEARKFAFAMALKEGLHDWVIIDERERERPSSEDGQMERMFFFQPRSIQHAMFDVMTRKGGPIH